MGKDNFYKNSLLLTSSNLMTGILKFMFAIVLSKKLGAEGMGLYGLIMPIYDLFCCLICGGMITAISRESSVYFNKRDYSNLNKSVHMAFIFDLVWSVSIAGLVFVFSPFISNHIIKDSRTLYSIMVICPALVFIGLSAIIKGYFYGTSNVKVPAIIDIVEKAIRMVVIISLINLLSLKSVTYTVTATYAALSVGELISFILFYIFYRRTRKKYYCKTKADSGIQLLFNIITISLPLCINTFLTTAISTVSTLVIPRRLIHIGMEHSQALAIIGKFSGMALTIVFFPMIVVMSISMVLIPDISKSLSQNDYYSLEKRIKEVLKISFLLGVSTLVICISIPTSLGELFFNRSDLGEYIKMIALCAPFAYMSVSSVGILNGLGKQNIVLRNSIITAVQQLILCYILIGIPKINIYGYGISFLITSLTLLILNYIEMRKICYLDISAAEIIIDIALSVLLYYVLKILNNVIPSSLSVFKYILIITVGFSLFLFGIAIITKAEE